MGYHAELVDLELPDFGIPTVEPIIPADTYRRRIVSLHSRAREEGYDVVVVYGDRELFAPVRRFGEFLLVKDRTDLENLGKQVGGIPKPASTKIVDLDMDTRKGGRQANTFPSWAASLSKLIELGLNKVMRLRALGNPPGSWDIIHQAGEESIIVKYPYEARVARQEYPLSQFHEFYRKYIPYNQRA